MVIFLFYADIIKLLVSFFIFTLVNLTLKSLSDDLGFLLYTLEFNYSRGNTFLATTVGAYQSLITEDDKEIYS